MKRLLSHRSLIGLTALLFGIIVLVSCSQNTVPVKPTETTETSEDNNQNNQETSTLDVKAWPSEKGSMNFPEDELNLKKTGICMSGGGTRAMVCAVGQLRGLVKLGILDNVGYISCVSGGSWASVPFTYYTEGAVDDEQLLGTIIPPGDLTLKGMKTLEPGFLAGAANAPLLGNMLRDIGSTPADRLWIRGVSQSYMQRYGLFKDGAPKYFSHTWATVRDICSRNPSLKPDDFVVVRNGKNDVHRPYLVVNSSVSGLIKNAPFNDPEPLSVFNYTPLGVGAGSAVNPIFRSKNGEVNTGYIGGFIEPFAFGTSAPTLGPVKCSSDAKNYNCLTLQKPKTPFTIADASGTSSSAYVATLTAFKIFGHTLSELSPRVDYWKVPQIGAKLPTGEDRMFGDGGNLENLGAITLIQRGVYDLVIFVNTDTKFNAKYDTIKYPTPTGKDVSSDILTLFGVIAKGSEDTYQNKIFEESDINGLMAQFVKAKNSGKSLIAETSHETVLNEWWGIPAGESVNIVWVYNESANEYVDQLEWEIRDQIKDLGGFPDFAHFPHYKTIMEDTGKLVELSPQQINLLYQFSAWNVYSNRDKFRILMK
ncbi:MAG: patatin-like phospholipase family protein [Crocinitomicaceae bacterium]|nr:patatin-like phospholipase family protein [Crocinitomicaceae bacterium]